MSKTIYPKLFNVTPHQLHTFFESCRANRANNRLVASSIIAIKYSFSPRPSSQSCSEVSHCTSSPQRLYLGRQTVLKAVA